MQIAKIQMRTLISVAEYLTINYWLPKTKLLLILINRYANSANIKMFFFKFEQMTCKHHKRLHS